MGRGNMQDRSAVIRALNSQRQGTYDWRKYTAKGKAKDIRLQDREHHPLAEENHDLHYKDNPRQDGHH